MSENVKVVSNFLAYDTEGNVTGIAGDMVHIFNKNESAVHDSPYFKRLEGRKNIVLMGDSLGDLQVDTKLTRQAKTRVHATLIQKFAFSLQVKVVLVLFHVLNSLKLFIDGTRRPRPRGTAEDRISE